MEQIIIKIKDPEKIQFLRELLHQFSFIEIDAIQIKKTKQANKRNVDFKSCFGIWKDRNITKQSLRDKAWQIK